MTFSQRAFLVLLLASITSNTYVYLYPFFSGCGFPPKSPPLLQPASGNGKLTYENGTVNGLNAPAPFRLLALGDPQLEGDTSISYAQRDSFRPRKLRDNLQSAESLAGKAHVLQQAFADLIQSGIPAQIKAWRKRLDLFGNDYYLAHIYRTLHWYTKPTHVTVLGDLLGSQWIDDAEFDRRSSRYWNRVFHDAKRVEDTITTDPTIEVLGEDKHWSRRIINIAGNHDIGYAGDLTPARLSRFERAFGAANWEIVFELPAWPFPNSPASDTSPPFLRLVIINSMILDTPAKTPELQQQTYDFINEVITRSQPVEDRRVGTIVLTHIPLHKEAGVCVDAPFFDFHSESEGGGLKEQNHLSYDAGKGILEGIYGMSGSPDAPGRGFGRQGIILTGHDHEGCDVYHHLPATDDPNPASRLWNATRWEDSQGMVREKSIPGVREVTLRSMMGEFGGFGYFVSAWFEADRGGGEWRFEVSRCSVGVQHWWWAAHVLALVTVGLGVVLGVVEISARISTPEKKKKDAGRVEAEVDDARNEAVDIVSGRNIPLGNGELKRRRP